MIAEDYAIINRKGGVGEKAQAITARAKDVAYMAENDQSVLNLPLGEVKMLEA